MQVGYEKVQAREGTPRILWGSIIPKLIETEVECLNVCLNITTT